MISKVYDGNRMSDRIVDEYMPQKTKHPRFKNLPRNVISIQQDNSLAEEHGLAPREDHDWIAKFLADIAQTRFDLEFWVEPRHSFEGVHNVYVFNGTECLGRIQNHADTSWQKTVYIFYNNRIDQRLHRERGKKTSKLATAKSIFRTYFTPITLKEQLKAIRNNVSTKINNTRYSSNSEVGNAESAIIKYIKTQLNNNDKLFAEYMNNAGAIDLVTAWLDKREEYSLVTAAYKKVDTNHGAFLLRKKLPNGEERYYFEGYNEHHWATRPPDCTDHRAGYAKEHLSEKVRLALGLLKVAEPNTFITGAGYKLDDDSFFIDAEEMEYDS